MIIAPMEAPLPTPAFAPMDKVEADVEDVVCEGRGVNKGSVDWAVLLSGCVSDEVGVVKEEDEEEGTGEDDDFRMELPVRCWMVRDSTLLYWQKTHRLTWVVQGCAIESCLLPCCSSRRCHRHYSRNRDRRLCSVCKI